MGTLFFSLGTFAEIELKFGPEFTFAIKYDGEPSSIRAFEQRAIEHLINGQPEGAKFKKNFYNKERMQSPNGWWFDSSSDRGVMEITMSPMTVSEWETYASDIQDAVFVTAYNTHLFPGLFVGGGHINVDIKPLLRHPLLLRNFLVDLWNHNELSLGIWNYDSHNATSLSVLDDRTRVALHDIIEAFDQELRKKRKPTKKATLEWIKNLAVQIDQAISPIDYFWDIRSRGKFIDYNFAHIETEQRFEIRAVRPQKDIYTWINQISLIRDRLKYLAKKRTPIPFRPRVKLLPMNVNWQTHKAQLTPPVNPQDALRSFYIYVTQAKHQWKDHRDYIWPNWISNGELKIFEQSVWFKQKQSECEIWL